MSTIYPEKCVIYFIYYVSSHFCIREAFRRLLSVIVEIIATYEISEGKNDPKLFVKFSSRIQENSDQSEGKKEQQPYCIRYGHMKSNISGWDLKDIHLAANDETSEHQSENVKRITFIGRTLQLGCDGSKWPYAESNHVDKGCGIPTKSAACDLAVLLNHDSGIEVPIMLCEINRSDTKLKDPFGKLAQKMAHCLAFFPIAFGMSVRDHDVSLYQFERDAKHSYISVTEERLPLFKVSVEKNITAQFCEIMEKVAKCILHTWLINVPKMSTEKLADFKELVEVEGRDAECYDSCWYIESIHDLDKNKNKATTK